MISKLDFGRFAAEADLIHADPDIFVSTRQSYAFHLPDHKIIIGRKGSGKSALEYSFNQNYKKKYDYLLSINAEAIRFRKLIEWYRELELYAGNTMELRKGLTNIWEYAILTSCMISVVDHGPTRNKYLTVLHNFLRKEGLIKKRIYDLLIDCLESVFTLVIGRRGKATSDIIRSIDNYPLDKVDFEDAKEALRNVLESGKGILITFDHIDRYFEVEARPYEKDGIEHYAIRNFLTGLVQAVYNISISVLRNHIQFKVFLPKDKFEAIRFRDLDKIKEFLFEIKWTAEELQEFIARRIAHSLGIRNKQGALVTDKHSTWYKIFPRTITNIQVSNIKEPVEEYLIRHTHYKPRDIQYYCSKAKNMALMEPAVSGASIPEHVIRQAVKEVSREIVDNLFIEFAYEYPFLKKMLEIFRHSSNILSFSIDFFPKIKKFISREKSQYNADDLVDLLFYIGFIGGISQNQRDALRYDIPSRKIHGNYYSFIFSYIDPTYNIRNCELVAIHPIFNDFLHLEIHPKIIVG